MFLNQPYFVCCYFVSLLIIICLVCTLSQMLLLLLLILANLVSCFQYHFLSLFRQFVNFHRCCLPALVHLKRKLSQTLLIFVLLCTLVSVLLPIYSQAHLLALRARKELRACPLTIVFCSEKFKLEFCKLNFFSCQTNM